MNYQDILDRLPYKSSFRFVDEITALDANGVTGYHTLRPDAFFFADHFPGNPITPGAIITEIMAQIGLVVLGIYLVINNADERIKNNDAVFPLLTSTEVEFFKMVLPEQTVKVISNKIYFRFGKLKCRVEIFDSNNEIIARGTFAGIIQKMIDTNNE